jgi:hypothetical protein
MDWIPGSVAHVYGLPRGSAIDNRVVAVKDHVSNVLRVHPAHVAVRVIEPSCAEGTCETAAPGKVFPVTIELRGSDVTVRPA